MTPTLTRIKNAILGTRYELSMAFVAAREMRRLNRLYRNKDRATDILSFSLSKQAGEILLCKNEMKKRARLCGRSEPNFLRFLFIHGLLHLKGFTHGSRMERQEIKFRKRFGI